MTPEEADEFLSSYEHIIVVERDLDPDDSRMGRAQFLVTLVDADNETVEADVAEYGLECFRRTGPEQFKYIALPPEE